MSIGCDIIKIWIALVNNCCLIQICPDPIYCVSSFSLIPAFRSRLRAWFKRIESVDVTQLKEKKERIAKVEGKERKILKAEIAADEEKLIIEKKILEFEERQDQYMSSFNKYVSQAVEQIRGSMYPYDAKPYLEKARAIIKEISEMVKDIKVLENKLFELIKAEKGLLKKEKKVA